MNGRVRAPEFLEGLAWLNSDRPLRIAKELRGQVVLLDFWTSCCINCMHVLPELADLEHAFAADPFVVIGVHSAKFTSEADPRAVRDAIRRYAIRHPVVVDQRMQTWQRYAVRAWPTLVLVDPEGYVVGAISGEGHREELEVAIRKLLVEHRRKGTLAAEPLKLRSEGEVRAASGLSYPGKVAADRASDRLFIADSRHHRIVVTGFPDEHGRCRLVRTIGSGAADSVDGPSELASFHSPQGLALAGHALYVADTDNHLIRRIDLKSFEVTRFAGTGEIGRDRQGGKRGTQQPINSPWDLASDGTTLYVAMAGLHQLWTFDLESRLGRPIAGSGLEDIVDGPARQAALAQPSGLALAGDSLYFADSEVSAVRKLDLAAKEVSTLIGRGLFEFGDVDGDPAKARLQHCLGVATAGERLFVADTFNHKLREIDLATGSLRTLLGDGRPGTHLSAGSPAFAEPGGLCAAEEILFIADTNNHRIVRIDLKGNHWNEVMIGGLTPPRMPDRKGSNSSPATTVIRTPAVILKKGATLELVLSPRFNSKFKPAPESPMWVRIEDSAHGVVGQRTLEGETLPLRMTLAIPDAAPPPWTVELSGACCGGAGDPVCRPFLVRWEVPFSWSTEGPESLQLTGAVKNGE